MAGGAIEGVMIFPNPQVLKAEGNVLHISYNVVLPGAVVSAKIYNLAGELVRVAENRETGREYIGIDVGDLAAGVYVVLVEATAPGSPHPFRRASKVVVIK